VCPVLCGSNATISQCILCVHSGEADEVVAYSVLRERTQTEAVVRQDLLQPSVARLPSLPRQTTAQ